MTDTSTWTLGGGRSSPLLMSLIVASTILPSGPGLRAQETLPADQAWTGHPWVALRLLEGSWRGAIDGRLGQGEAVRTYEFIFGGRYLVSRHASVRMPQAASPEGDHHRELGVYSYDSDAETLVLREFMEEGYVVRSTCATEPGRIVCESQEVESGTGIRARLTLEVENSFHFREIYELAWPGQEEMELYFDNEWERVPDLQNPR